MVLLSDFLLSDLFSGTNLSQSWGLTVNQTYTGLETIEQQASINISVILIAMSWNKCWHVLKC